MHNRTREMDIAGTAYLVRSTAIKADLKFDQILASIAPVSDFTGHIRRMQQRIFLFSGLVLLVVLPLSLLVSRKISGSLVLLEEGIPENPEFRFFRIQTVRLQHQGNPRAHSGFRPDETHHPGLHGQVDPGQGRN
jgi:hypothetical protein